ncbi:hypothetical protein, partial [Klebsiella pneumoniae]|uniref:hypothetical protein n=1 Tax=Klebsiella pneumoniae TaxID=573 RepID=UPI001D0EFD59
KRAYCLKIQPATGSFARNLIYSTKPTEATTNSLKIKAGLMPIVSLHTSAYYGGGVDLLPENSAGLN